MIYKTLHRKLKIEQHEPNWKSWVHSSASIELAITLFETINLFFRYPQNEWFHFETNMAYYIYLLISYTCICF
jgi:hypothetical protein